MPVRLYIVRHGETEWSLSGRHTGLSDIPLTKHGEEEARRLTPTLRNIPLSTALCSPRQRARRTCELAGVGQLIQIDPDLAEWDYGDYEGQRTPDILRDRPGWNIFADGCPKGETPEQVTARAERLIERLLTLSGDVALFSHGHFSRVLAARWIGLPVACGRRLMLDTGTVSILRDDPRHPEDRVIALWNAVPSTPLEE